MYLHPYFHQTSLEQVGHSCENSFGVQWDLFLEFRWMRERVKQWKEHMKKEENQYAASKRKGELIAIVGALLKLTKMDGKLALATIR